MFALAIAITGCRFDGSGVPVDLEDASEPEPRIDASTGGAGDKSDATVDATVDANVDASVDARADVVCPNTYVRLSNGPTLHRLGNANLDWEDAEADCAHDGAGIHLVVIDDAREVADVSSHLGAGKGWVGVSARVRPWLTVTGKTASFLPWLTGQPDNDDGTGGEECVEIDAGKGLNDVECDRKKRYVCECDGIPVDPAAF